MDVSLFLAKVLGLYLVLVCLPMLLNYKNFLPVLKEGVENASFMLLSGVMAIIFGILLIVTHNVWAMDWRVLITLTGWLGLTKGMVLFVFPKQMLKITNTVLQVKPFCISISVSVIIGFCLIYHGYFA
jgi:hypothetical protein